MSKTSVPSQLLEQSQVSSITLILSPYHVGQYGDAVGAGPLILKEGVLLTLKGLGIEVREVTIKPSMEADGDIGRSFEIIRQTSKAVTEARNAHSFPMVLSGNCSASVGVHAGVSGSRGFEDAAVGCIWFDAHDDFNIPDTVLSGYFDSMPIATMAGQCWKALCGTIPGYRPVKLSHIVHCGLRDLNELERNRVEAAGFPVVWGSTKRAVDFPSELNRALSHEKREYDLSIVHVDLDCLDSSVGQVNKFEPAPGGLSEDALVECMKILPEEVPVGSLTVASYDPKYDPDGRIVKVAVKAIGAFVHSLMDVGLLLRKTR